MLSIHSYILKLKLLLDYFTYLFDLACELVKYSWKKAEASTILNLMHLMFIVIIKVFSNIELHLFRMEDGTGMSCL